MLRSAATRAIRPVRALRAISGIPNLGDSFDKEGHVLVTEQEQGNISQRVQEAAANADLSSYKKDTRWMHVGETMADLILRESLEALQEAREAEVARRMSPERPLPGCGVHSHAHDCCCGGGEDEVGAPGIDVEPAGKATGGAQA